MPSEGRVAAASVRAKPVLSSSPVPAAALPRHTLSAASSAPAGRARAPKGAAPGGTSSPQKETPNDSVSDSLQELRKRENMEARAISADAASPLPVALKKLAGYGIVKPISHTQQAEKVVQLEEERFDNIRKQVDFELKKIRRQRVLSERDMERKEKAHSRYQDIEKDLESTKAQAEEELRNVREQMKSATYLAKH